MIFYFSATGNCKYVAMRLAEATHDRTISITDCMKAQQFDFTTENGENIGFVTPTYFWGLPTVVTDFLEKMTITNSGEHYVYHVLTYYTTTGQAHRMMNHHLKKHGLSLNGKFIVQMPDTWTPVFNLSDKDKNANVLLHAEIEVDSVRNMIHSKATGDFNNKKIPLVAGFWYKRLYKNDRKTVKFFVDSCIGCGLCERQCPVSAIEIQNKRPVWVKEQCTLCLGCLHRCPSFSIQYGENTRKHVSISIQMSGYKLPNNRCILICGSLSILQGTRVGASLHDYTGAFVDPCNFRFSEAQ